MQKELLDSVEVGKRYEITNATSEFFGHSLLVFLVDNLVDIFDETAENYVTLPINEFLAII